MILDIILLIVGFIVLIKGADFFVDGASAIADNFKVPKIFIGLTIVAFGTSAPELAVSIKSIISNNHDIVLGNVIGSNIVNILLIVGLSALIKPLIVKNNTIKKELPILLLISALFVVLLSDQIFNGTVNAFTRSDGIVLVLFFLVFIYYLIEITVHRDKDLDSEVKNMSLIKAIIFTILGLGMIVFGSNYVVNSSSNLAEVIGVSKKLIALTIIAIGTSLPELVTSVTATKKGECDLAIGNIVGSCIFNIGVVMALPVTIFGGINQINYNGVDLYVMLISVLFLFIFAANDKKISKKEGILFLLFFVAYYTIVIINK
jgi:cation:H+ antiporter